jgi:YidC/Oxa1 family membrane protein insertase
MDRTAWIAITLSVIGLVAWQVYYSSHYPPVTAAAHVASASPTAAPAAEGQPAAVAGAHVEDAHAAPAADQTPEKIETVRTAQLEVQFTNLGGGIAEVIPLGHQNLVEGGLDIQLNHTGHIPIGAVSFKAGEETRLPYTMTRDGNSVSFERATPDGLKIDKDFSFNWQGDAKQIPAIDCKITFTNTNAAPYSSGDYYVYAGSASPIHRRDAREAPYLAFDYLSEGHYHTEHATAFDAGKIPVIGVQTHAARDVIDTPLTKAQWVAVKNQFYATILAPLDPSGGQDATVTSVWGRRFDLPLTDAEQAGNLPALHGLDAALGLPALHLAPGASVTRTFQIYAGPKYYSRLEKLGHDEQEVMDFGKFKIVSITLLSLMNFFKSILGNYGLAIILLTILVKSVLFPLQNKANKSMKRMSILQPKVAELREKYKDDAARLNTETMKLYKEYGINPLGGCLPMAVQMPIFFGFLYMLYTAAELRNSGFLWVHDLSQPDTVAHLAGLPINVLPMLMIGTQFWQMSLTPRTGDPSQQKMMMFMPLVFGFFCYNFAAALALYYMMQGLLTVLQLYLTRTQPTPALVRINPGGRGGAAGSGKKTGVPKRLKI